MGLSEVEAGIARACERAGRRRDEVTLIAVSKVQPEARVRAVLDAGHRVFGENRVQEAEERWTPLRAERPDIRLHLIGALQTNKARAAMAFFDAIHTVDRPKLARTLARLRDEGVPCPELFVQVNTGEEEQKAGVAPAGADALIAECRALDLPLTGLMCIPPEAEEPSPHFALLRKIAERNGLTGLSMGMSGDYDAAIGQGASHVRVGSAVFGARRA
ncbi:MAG: YggS family pyridoxal phosphate-dependent enzyme [Hasllibacter sp.]